MTLPDQLRAYGSALAQIGQIDGAVIVYVAADEIERLLKVERAYGEMLRDEKLRDDATRWTRCTAERECHDADGEGDE